MHVRARHFPAVAISLTLMGLSSSAVSQTCVDLFRKKNALGVSTLEVQNDLAKKGPVKRTQWTAELVVRAIRLAHAEGARFDTAFIRTPNRELEEKISKKLGVKVTAVSIYQAALKRFDDWDAALLAAGLDPLTQKVKIQWDQKLVIRAIHAADQSGAPLHSRFLRHQSDEALDEKISKKLGFKVTANAIYQAALAHFQAKDGESAWSQALRAAGLDPSHHHEKIHWDRNMVIQAIRIMQGSLNGTGTKTSSTWLAKAGADDIDRQISIALRFPVTKYAVYQAAQHLFADAKGSAWDAALVAAGIQPRTVWEKARWDKKNLIEAIQIAHFLGANLTPTEFQKQQSDQFIRHFRGAVGFDTSTQDIYRASLRHWSTWTEARAEAIPRYTPRWTKPEIQEQLQILKAAGCLSAETVETDFNGEISWELSLRSGRFVLGKPFVDSVRRLYGSWIAAVAAGKLREVPQKSTQDLLLNSENSEYHGLKFNFDSASTIERVLYSLTDIEFKSEKGRYDRHDAQSVLRHELNPRLRDPKYDADLLWHLLTTWEIYGVLEKGKLLENLSIRKGAPVSEEQLLELFKQMNAVLRQ